MAGRKCAKAPRGAFSLLRQTFSNLEAVTNTRRHNHLVAVHSRGVRTIHVRYGTASARMSRYETGIHEPSPCDHSRARCRRARPPTRSRYSAPSFGGWSSSATWKGGRDSWLCSAAH